MFRLLMFVLPLLALPLPAQPWAVSEGEDSGMSAPVPRLADSGQRLTLTRTDKSSFQLSTPPLLSVQVAAFVTHLGIARCMSAPQQRSFLVFGVLRLEGG